MQNMLQGVEDDFKLAPEAMAIIDTYLSSLDIEQTANELSIPQDIVVRWLNKKEVQRFLDTVFLEQGYANRFKTQKILDKIIESKLAEAEESGVYSGKDLLDILKLQHDIVKDMQKLSKESSPSSQTNIQVNNHGDNLTTLLDKILKD